jgi:hypothetical protein
MIIVVVVLMAIAVSIQCANQRGRTRVVLWRLGVKGAQWNWLKCRILLNFQIYITFIF